MRVPPADLDEARLRRLLARRWGFEATDLRYAPVGYGSHHWVATAATGDRRFVTVDELGRLGRLRAAMRSAVALRDDGGLEFVVAPLPATDGGLVATLDDAFAVTVLPFVEGRPWDGGADAGLLARLHAGTRAAAPYARRDDLELEARADLEDALDQLREPWDAAGPYAAFCRDVLADAADDIRGRLAACDRLAAACRARGEPAVLTHGEPKPDNLLVTDAGPALVDWDTALLAPAARDDIALFVRRFRGPHVHDADTAAAWDALRHLLAS